MSNESHKETSTSIEERIVFFLVAVGVITVTLVFLRLIDFIPEKPTAEKEVEVSVVKESSEKELGETVSLSEEEAETVVEHDAYPHTVVFDSLDREIAVLNPDSTAVDVLDSALLKGAVRHPDSADFVNTGTIFLLGHSSYLPNVVNKNFQAFNGIQKLAWGDIIRVVSSDMEYVYSVDRVYEAKASDAEVPLQFEVPKLVLATCNSFGTKDDRYIVEASLVMKRAIRQ